MKEKFDEEYFEYGIQSGKSLYSNYRWIPELTIPMAHNIIKNLEISTKDRVLDFGCAKGYLVKAMRLLDINCWGYDISEYAVHQVPREIEEFVFYTDVWKNYHIWDWIICKDVLEHVPYNQIKSVIFNLCQHTKNLFIVVPLSSDGLSYNEPIYEHDITHIIRENIQWWIDQFQNSQENNVEHILFSTEFHGVKDHWKKKSANGFLTIKINNK
jgi:SAM-dependent methyltransferase